MKNSKILLSLLAVLVFGIVASVVYLDSATENTNTETLETPTDIKAV